eukprot:5092143-Pleurochrysis_carterae.AAC.1
MMRKVHEHALRSSQQLVLKERAHERLIGPEKTGVDGARSFAGQGILYHLRQRLRGRGARLLEGQRHAVRQVCRHKVCDVLLLRERNLRVASGDVNVEKIRNGPFVFNVSAAGKSGDKVLIQRSRPIMRVQRE